MVGEAKTSCKMNPMKKTLLLFALSLLTLPLFAQQTRIVPDCVIPFSFTAAAQHTDNTLTCGNNTLGIVVWTVVYSNFNFGALSLVVQSAPDAGGVPGAWSTFAGTVCSSTNCPGSSGVNPNTATTSAFTTLQGYYPWMRVLLTSATGTGTITGKLYGCLSPGCSTTASAAGGSAITIAGTGNQIGVTGTGCTGAGTCTIFIPTNPILPGLVTGGGFVSSEADSGSLGLNGLTSGNVTMAVNDIAGTAIVYVWPSTNGTAGQVLEDNGVTTCPTLPAGSPAVCHQLIWTTGGGGTAGGGVLGYSATALVLPAAGTTFLPPVGGGIASTTETNVTANAPAAAAISNMYVSISSAPGVGNTIAFTYRDAASSTALTCTISGAVATTCNDITHSFTPVVGDALAIQVVTTGTVVIAPAIKIIAEYGVTGGGGGGPSLHYQYYPINCAATMSSAGLFPNSGNSCGNSLTLPLGASPNIASWGTYVIGGGDGLLIIQLPSTWDGSAILADLDAIFPNANAGTANFRGYSACVASGSNPQAPTWTAASATVGLTTTSGIARWHLSIPVTGCSAGNFAWIDINRPSGDSYGSTLFAIGANIGIKY